MISCIMPTRGRKEYAARAVRCLAEQTCKDWELIVVDDELDPSFIGPEISRIIPANQVFYTRHLSRDIAQKRNLCCSMAHGEYICHWDSDDWYAPERLADQLERIAIHQKAVTGYHSMYFMDEARQLAYWYRNDKDYAIGVSLFYQREWWKDHSFAMPVEHPLWGEDNNFVTQARKANQLSSVSAELMIVASIHSGNTAPKSIKADNCSYYKIGIDKMPKGAMLCAQV